MKKIGVMALVLVLAVSALPQNSEAAAGYKFKYKGVKVSMHGKAAKLIKKAGKPIKKTVKKSCAYKGKDRTYKYKDFILYTYSHTDNGTEYVNGITILTNKLSTMEKIKIGSTETQLKSKYGKGKAKFGIYTYKKGKSKIQFAISAKKVKNIRYVAL